MHQEAYGEAVIISRARLSPTGWQLKGRAPPACIVGQPPEPRETLMGDWLIFLDPKIFPCGLYSLVIIAMVGGQGAFSPATILFNRVLGENRQMSNFLSAINALVMHSDQWWNSPVKSEIVNGFNATCLWYSIVQS